MSEHEYEPEYRREPLKQIHGDIENHIRDTYNSYTLDANDKMFLNLKWMFDTKVLTSDDFKNIVDKYKDNSNSIKWKREHEDLLVEICEKCKVFSWFHRRTADMLRVRDNRYIYSIIVLNTLTSMFTLIGSSYDEYIDTKLIALISGGVNLSTSLVTAIYKKINMGGTVDSHLFAVNMYTKLSHNISSQLTLSPEEREPMPKYLKDKLSEYENLILESPIIPEHIKEDGLKRISKMQVCVPNEIAGGVDKVDVYRCEEKENIALAHPPQKFKNIKSTTVPGGQPIRPLGQPIRPRGLPDPFRTTADRNIITPEKTEKEDIDVMEPLGYVNKSALEVEKMFVTMKAEPEKDSRVEASIMIQKHFRGFSGRRYCKMLREKEICNKSATIIQKHFRGYSARKK